MPGLAAHARRDERPGEPVIFVPAVTGTGRVTPVVVHPLVGAFGLAPSC